MMHRRSMLLGLGAALAAPAIVRAESLMRIARLREPAYLGFDIGSADFSVSFFMLNREIVCFSQKWEETYRCALQSGAFEHGMRNLSVTA